MNNLLILQQWSDHFYLRMAKGKHQLNHHYYSLPNQVKMDYLNFYLLLNFSHIEKAIPSGFKKSII